MRISPKNIEEIELEGKKIRIDLFKKFCEVQEGHPGSILSIFDIVNVLYTGEFLQLDADANINDSFIMSKGHAAAVQYPFLVQKGLIPQKDWDDWGTGDSILRVFGNNGIPGIDVTSGSLGHGVGIGAGMALANRMENNQANIWVVISEGELYEGSTWEALLFVAHQNLRSVKIILDVNRNMILGRPEDCVQLESLESKMQAFNFETLRIDGHSYPDIFTGLTFLKEVNERPRVLIADTIKGKGVSFMEDQASSHYWGNLTEKQMSQMIEELSQ